MSDIPKPATFPEGGTVGGVTCDKCGEPASNAYEGAAANSLDLCDSCLEDLGGWLNDDSDEELTHVEQWEQHSQGIYYDEPDKPGEMWDSDDWQMVVDQHIERRVQWFCDMCSGHGPISNLRKARSHVESHSQKLVEKHETPRDEMDTATDGGTRDVDEQQSTLADSAPNRDGDGDE